MMGDRIEWRKQKCHHSSPQTSQRRSNNSKDPKRPPLHLRTFFSYCHSKKQLPRPTIYNLDLIFIEILLIPLLSKNRSKISNLSAKKNSIIDITTNPTNQPRFHFININIIFSPPWYVPISAWSNRPPKRQKHQTGPLLSWFPSFVGATSPSENTIFNILIITTLVITMH